MDICLYICISHIYVRIGLQCKIYFLLYVIVKKKCGSCWVREQGGKGSIRSSYRMVGAKRKCLPENWLAPGSRVSSGQFGLSPGRSLLKMGCPNLLFRGRKIGKRLVWSSLGKRVGTYEAMERRNDTGCVCTWSQARGELKSYKDELKSGPNYYNCGSCWKVHQHQLVRTEFPQSCGPESTGEHPEPGRLETGSQGGRSFDGLNLKSSVPFEMSNHCDLLIRIS